MPIKIILADDHPLYLEGLKLLIKENKNFEILGDANNGFNAIELAKISAN